MKGLIYWSGWRRPFFLMKALHLTAFWLSVLGRAYCFTVGTHDDQNQTQPGLEVLNQAAASSDPHHHGSYHHSEYDSQFQ